MEGSDPSRRLSPISSSEFPVLRALVATWGDPYTRSELDALGTFVHGFFQVPPLESGVEAFVRCAEADPLAFAGWRMLSCAYREGAEALSPIDCYVLHHHRSDLLLTDDERFGPASLRVLEQVAWRLRLPPTPRTFLLWENSD